MPSQERKDHVIALVCGEFKDKWGMKGPLSWVQVAKAAAPVLGIQADAVEEHIRSGMTDTKRNAFGLRAKFDRGGARTRY